MITSSGVRLLVLSALFFPLLFTSSVAHARDGVSPGPTPQSSQAAKKEYALIYGTVWTPDNHPAAGVPIKIRRSGDNKPKWELMSDRNGEFAQRVPAGEDDYIVWANIKTPKGQPKPEVKVHIEGDERQDVGIHLTAPPSK